MDIIFHVVPYENDRSQHNRNIIGVEAVEEQSKGEKCKEAAAQHLNFVFIYILLSLVQEPHILFPNPHLSGADLFYIVCAMMYNMPISFTRPFVPQRFLADHLVIALLVDYPPNSGLQLLQLLLLIMGEDVG
jgi:hypothetical protein